MLGDSDALNVVEQLLTVRARVFPHIKKLKQQQTSQVRGGYSSLIQHSLNSDERIYRKRINVGTFLRKKTRMTSFKWRTNESVRLVGILSQAAIDNRIFSSLIHFLSKGDHLSRGYFQFHAPEPELCIAVQYEVIANCKPEEFPTFRGA